MKTRTLAIVAAVMLGLGVAGLAAAPAIADYVATAEVDKALEQIRRRGTAVVTRGDVEIDLGRMAVGVSDIRIDSPGADGAKVRIGRMMIERPTKDGDLLLAEHVVFEDVAVGFGSETLTLPRIEAFGYVGPARGLVTTPGVGRNARSQAEVIARVSLSRATTGALTYTGADGRPTRTVKSVAIERVVNGVVGRMTLEGLTLSAALPAPSAGEAGGGAIEATAASVVNEGLSLPTLWRFYSGDGQGAREPLIARMTIADVDATLRGATTGPAKLSIGQIEAADVAVRPLAYPPSTLQQIEDKLKAGERLTPADLRKQILVMVDASGAAAFGRVAVSNVAFEASPPDADPVRGAIGLAELTGYADARLAGVAVERLETTLADGGSVKLARAALSGADATGLVTYADRVGQDEALLTRTPSPEDMLKLWPRAATLEATGADVAVPGAALTIGAIRATTAGPVGDIPQRLSFRLEGLDAPLPDVAAFEPLKAAGLEAVRGGYGAALAFDQATKVLRLETLDLSLDKLFAVKLTGEVGGVEATLATASGGDLVSKLAAVTVRPFEVTLRDEGAVAVALAATAPAAGLDVDAHREAVASFAAETATAVLGPLAQGSVDAIAAFVRGPKTLDVKVAPKTSDLPLLDLLGAFQLGTEGLVQVVDVTIANRD